MDISKLGAGEKAPEEVNVFIEIPQGGTTKYEIDKESGILMADRFVHGAMFYPFNYGFVPGTLDGDGDSIDVLVISTYPVAQGCAIKARVIGGLVMEDEAGSDTKILAVPIKKIDPTYADVESIDDLPKIVRDKIKNFFDHYKDLEEGKWVKTGEFFGKEEAYEAVKKSMK
jgi:inorganic pyrophosphatase